MAKDIQHILDASTLINFLANEPKVVDKMLSLDDSKTYLTPIAIAECYYGIFVKKLKLATDLSVLLNRYGVIPINSDCAIQWARIKQEAKITSRNMDRDIWMVAFCQHIGATLLTTDKEMLHRLRDVNPPIELIEIN